MLFIELGVSTKCCLDTPQFLARNYSTKTLRWLFLHSMMNTTVLRLQILMSLGQKRATKMIAAWWV